MTYFPVYKLSIHNFLDSSNINDILYNDTNFIITELWNIIWHTKKLKKTSLDSTKVFKNILTSEEIPAL